MGLAMVIIVILIWSAFCYFVGFERGWNSGRRDTVTELEFEHLSRQK